MGQLADNDALRHRNSSKSKVETIGWRFIKTIDGPKRVSFNELVEYLESIISFNSEEDSFLKYTLAEDVLIFLKSQGYRETTE